ncbi:MAG: AMP-binding protein [Actinobacteria bacterium]|nr:AMP-binding protein [Actinomycetota bacterium]
MIRGCVAWPDDIAEHYRREGWWTGETLADLLRQPARTTPDRVALVAGGQRWTYAELDAWCDRVAAGFSALGLEPGDRVVVQLPNVAELVATAIALFRLRVLPVFALAAHRRAEVVELSRDSGARVLVVPDVHQGYDYRNLAREVRAAVASVERVVVVGDAAEFVPFAALEAAPPAIELVAPDPAEVAFFLLSGGTTGVPKLIPRTHDDYAFQLRATAEAMRFGEDGAYLAVLPVAHNAALGCPGVLGALRAGGKAVLAASASPDEAFPLAEREGATLTTLMPPLVAVWLEFAELLDARVPGLVVEVGGARLAPEQAARVAPALGATLTHWFGMAEGFLSFTRLDDPEPVAVATQGRPLCPGDEVRVVDGSGADVPPGATGELLVRGPTTLRGYFAAPEHNARAFTPDGFLRTGDLVRIDENGNLVVEGRLKDVVNRGGEKVSAEEVEEHAVAHPRVRAAALVAMPDPLMGEKTCLFLDLDGDDVGLDEMRTFLAGRELAEFKLPDRVERVDRLPITAVGKVDKADLRARLVAGEGEAPPEREAAGVP